MTTAQKSTPTKQEAAPKPETPAEVDPFASLEASPVDTLFTSGGRPAKPVPDSVKALVRQSYADGKPVTLRVAVKDKDTAEALAKQLRKGGMQHDPILTVRVTVEADGTAVRFKAGPKVTKGKGETPAVETPAEGTNAA